LMEMIPGDETYRRTRNHAAYSHVFGLTAT
jgi:hypothetical protein